MEHYLLAKFDRDFREYILSAVRYAELQTPYRALDIEDEIKWIKNWLKENTYEKLNTKQQVCPSSPYCSHNTNGRSLEKPCSLPEKDSK